MSTKQEGRSFAIFRSDDPVKSIAINVAQRAQSRAQVTAVWVEQVIDEFKNADRSLMLAIENNAQIKDELVAHGMYDAKIANLKKLQLAYDDSDIRRKVWEWLCSLYTTDPKSSIINIDPKIEIPTEVSIQ